MNGTVAPMVRAAKGSLDSPVSSARRSSSHGSGAPKSLRRICPGADLNYGCMLTGPARTSVLAGGLVSHAGVEGNKQLSGPRSVDHHRQAGPTSEWRTDLGDVSCVDVQSLRVVWMYLDIRMRRTPIQFRGPSRLRACVQTIDHAPGGDDKGELLRRRVGEHAPTLRSEKSFAFRVYAFVLGAGEVVYSQEVETEALTFIDAGPKMQVLIKPLASHRICSLHDQRIAPCSWIDSYVMPE